uniref:Secretory carrier membrane protein n=1 Tax=Bicosoecida sp. CB-2014 TaxID=1486930 RepID=A0A7S1CE41_9STRA
MAAAGRAVAGSAFRGVTAGATAATRGAAGSEIDWTNFNYPCSGEPCNLLHFDLAELRGKQGDAVFTVVRTVYAWFLLSFGVVCLNFLNSFILAVAIDSSVIYSGVNVVYGLFNFIIASVCGLFVVYNIYKGLAVPSPKAKRNGQAVMVVLLILSFIQMLMGAGNTNGFANFGTDRMALAEAADLGIVGYWKAMTVIESLLWMGAVGLGVFAFWRLHTF